MSWVRASIHKELRQNWDITGSKARRMAMALEEAIRRRARAKESTCVSKYCGCKECNDPT